MGSLFDDDEDVEIASSRSLLSRRYSASSGASRPPTSESEGAFDGYYDLDKDEVDDEDEAEELPAKTSVPSRSSTKQRTQVTGGLRKRDAALKSEVRSLFISSFV